MCIFWVFFILTQYLLIMSVPTIAHLNCSTLRDNLAISTSEFTACAIQNSRPIKLCENCVQSYIRIIGNYSEMTHFVENETRCIDNFINLDRLQIVETLYTDSYNLWNDAKCYECFQFVNGSLTGNKSEQTLNFNKYYETFMKCINNSDINNTLCSTCMDPYMDLNNYYISISDENLKIGVCMDIVDMMNTTRSFWSPTCCKYREHNEYIFIASAIAVLILTLCFYVVTQFCTVRKTPTILQQHRFVESVGSNQPLVS